MGRERVLKRLPILLIFIFLMGCSDLCENEVISTSKPINNKYTAYMFRRDCGMTTAYSYQLTIKNKDQKLGDGGGDGNVFTSNQQFSYRWIDNSTIEIRYYPSDQVVIHGTKFKDIDIKYIKE